MPLVDVVRPARQGDLFAHCGRLLHGGAPVTKGKRLLLVGFVHVRWLVGWLVGWLD